MQTALAGREGPALAALKKCTGCIRAPQPVAEFVKGDKELKTCRMCREKSKMYESKRAADPVKREARYADNREKNYSAASRAKRLAADPEAFRARNAAHAAAFRAANPDYYKIWKATTPSYAVALLRARAEGRDIAWDLDLAFALATVQLPCLYCGVLDPAHLNGIDRLDNATGYLPDNCVPCCWTCNMMKNTLDPKTFVARCGHLSHRAGGPGAPSPQSWPEYDAQTTCATYRSGHDERNRKRVKRGDDPLEFALDPAAFEAVRAAPCAYCGMGDRNGIDRVDSALGYVAGNCVPCCSECNYMKNAFSVEVFVQKCEAIAARDAAGAFQFPDVATSLKCKAPRATS